MKKLLLEKEIIANLLTHPEKMPEVSQVIGVEDFAEYGEYFTIILDAWKNSKNISTELISKGIKGSQIAELYESFYTRPVTSACKELREINNSIRLRDILSTAAEAVPEENVDGFIGDLQRKLLGNMSQSSSEKSDIESIIEEFSGAKTQYEAKRKDGYTLAGLDTGYPKLNDLIDGLRPGHLWIIGGYTNLGKTFASINIMANILKAKKRTVFYSLEMSRVDILSRTLGVMMNENGLSVVKGYVDEEKVAPHLKIIRESDLAIHNEKAEINQILLSMHEEVMRKPVDLFVVDFIQLVKDKHARSEYEAVSSVVLELQQAAKRFNAPIIALSQVSNESVRGGEQLVMGFKGSGTIASAADLAIELVNGEESATILRQKMNDGEPVSIKWQIRKNRHGRVGYIPMRFTGKTGVFSEVDEDDF